MALFHLSVTQTKRSAGQSAIASAAYRAGERLYSEYYGEYSDYTRKGGVICSDILLPSHAPPEYADRQTLWNAVEKAERGKNAQLAYSFDIALQNEFSLEENIALARQFLLENFVSRGMVVDFAVHQPDREDGGIPNPHFHVLCPMEFYGKSFPEAVQMLTGENGEGQTEATTAPPTAFHLPLHNRTADRAIQYLCESRGLNPKLVEAFLLSGDIYEDAKRHNVVFVGRDRSGTPRYAHVRGTADPFRQDIAGSDKSYPFRYEGNGNQLFVFEAPIDLLSFICLYPQDWQTRNYLALGGVSGKALDRFLSERKDTRKVFLCLDSDTAGSEACTRLAQSIPGEIAVIRLVPARKDWNDVLRQQGDIPSRKFIAETITLRELPTAQPVPMLRMADVELTSVDWLWFPYIPFGKLTIIQGNPGEGKTYFAMRLAAACTNRKPLPGMETLEPFNIIYQTAEDGLGDTVKPRLMEAEADLERVLVIDDRDTPLTLADERIARAIRENNARLVIIDPVQAFLGADVDMNRANEVRPIFRSLGDIAQATGCAIVLIGHLNKAAGTQSTYRGLGSIDITAAVRSLLFIGKLKDSPTTRVLIHEKSSLAPPGQSLAFSLGDEKGFEWIGAYDITADELLAGTDTAKTESKTAQAQMLILELLADGKRMPSAELEKAVNERGISSRTMRTAKSRIGDRLVTEKDGTAWVCYLRD